MLLFSFDFSLIVYFVFALNLFFDLLGEGGIIVFGLKFWCFQCKYFIYYNFSSVKYFIYFYLRSMYVYFYHLVDYFIHYYMQFEFKLAKNNFGYILCYTHSVDFFANFHIVICKPDF